MKLSNYVAIAALGSLLPVVGLACGERLGVFRASMLASEVTGKAQILAQPDAATAGNEESSDNSAGYHRQAIVGTWLADWFVGHTNQRYDRLITIFHADGNETENDIAVPPATENVCYGVWEQTGRNQFTMRHVGWVFDRDGNYLGAVEVVATVSLTNHGSGFRGRYVLEQYDPAGNIIPADHADGDIKGTRYTLTNGIVDFLKANP
jgi:hypothetical protein